MKTTRPVPKKIVITGASGYLGRRLCRIAASSHQVVATYRQHPDQIAAGEPHALDITDSQQFRALLAHTQPDAVIHCAAANPGVSEDVMQRVNIDGSRQVAMDCNTAGVRLIHVSTDMVHDGNHAPYLDDATPSPTNTYGRTKAEGESVIISNASDVAVVRTSLIYGLHEIDRGTAGFVARLEAGEPLMLFSDVIRQPVFVDSLCDALISLAVEKTDSRGLFNIAGRQALDRAQFAMRMLQWWGVDYDGRLTTGPARNLKNPPPLDLRLVLDRASKTLNMTFPGVDDIVELDAHDSE